MIEDGDLRGQPSGLFCQHPGCNTQLHGNPNDKQCDRCTKLLCSKHQRLVEWGVRMCVTCKPKSGKRRHNHRRVAA